MKYKLLPLLVFLLINYFSIAQNNLSETEIDLINRSLEKNYTLKEASHELSIDSLESKTIRQNFIPTLELDALYGYGASRINVDIPTVQLPITGIELFEGESRFDAAGQVFNTNLTAKALLFSGLQVNYGSKASEEKIKAKNFMLNATKSDIIKDVIDTFDKIELLKHSEIVITKSEERLAKEKERVVKAIENGVAIPYDRQKITAAELNLASKKAELYGNLSLLYLKLSMLTNVDIATLEKHQFDLKPWMLQNDNNTFKNRPELKALGASISAYDYKLKMNRNAFLPKVQALASLSYSNLLNANLQTPYSLPEVKM
jgi:outer membrane protein TolC